MAGKNTVTLSFAGDSKSLDTTVKNVDKSLDSVKDHADKATHGTHDLGEGLETSVKHFRGGKDALDGLSGAASAFGLALPGPIGGILTFAGGMADLADGLATTVLPALKGVWATMLANPLVAIIAGVVLVGAAFVLLYKKSETFRNIVNGAFKSVKAVAADLWAGIKWAFDKVVGYFQFLWDSAVRIVDGVKGAFSGIGDAIAGGFRAGTNVAIDIVNGLADVWNDTIGELPGVPSIHHIAHRATGGPVSAGTPYWVGERGPELFMPPSGGGQISPAAARGAPASSGGTWTTQVVLDGRVVAESVQRNLLQKKRTSGALGLA